MVASAIGASAAGGLVSGALNSSASSSAASTQAKQEAASAASLGQAGASAQTFLNPYVAAGRNELGNITSNMSLWGNINNDYTNQANTAYQQAGNYVGDAQGAFNQSSALNTRAQSTLDTQADDLINLQNGGITQQSIQNLPGYAAINALGQEGVTNSAAARGLADSGAALKGAANYATTMADQSYQNLYQDQLSTANALSSNASGYLGESQAEQGIGSGYLNMAAGEGNVGSGYLGVNSANQGNLTNTFNRENALADYGLTAAQDSVENALTAAGASNAYATGGANALAAGQIGSTNALTSGLGNAASIPSQYLLYQQLLNGGGQPYGSNTYGNNGVYYGSSYNPATSPQVSGIYG